MTSVLQVVTQGHTIVLRRFRTENDYEHLILTINDRHLSADGPESEVFLEAMENDLKDALHLIDLIRIMKFGEEE